MTNMTENTYLVTGAMGCIGAWILYHLVKSGKKAVSFDLSENRHRLNLLLSEEEQQNITFIQGDLTDYAQVLAAHQQNNITHVIHLAALQVPFVRANPVLGAQVNVVGTINMFEAARATDIKHLTYASSIAVYGTPDDYPPGLLTDASPPNPHTLYGVYKVDNEHSAKVYWWDHQISSTALRPYTIYGVGRDQGLTSEPTKAMLAAAARKDYHINFGGRMQFHFASDVAQQFIEAAENPLDGAYAFNLGTEVVAVARVAEIINSLKNDVTITHDENLLPFPEGTENTSYKQNFQGITETSIEAGIQQTISHFEQLLSDGKLSYSTD